MLARGEPVLVDTKVRSPGEWCCAATCSREIGWHQGTGARCPELGALKGCRGLQAHATGVSRAACGHGDGGVCVPTGTW